MNIIKLFYFLYTKQLQSVLNMFVPQAKALIRQLLPQGLGDEQSRVRAMVVSDWL